MEARNKVSADCCAIEPRCGDCGTPERDPDHLRVKWANLVGASKRGASPFWQTAIEAQAYFDPSAPGGPDPNSAITAGVVVTRHVAVGTSAMPRGVGIDRAQIVGGLGGSGVRVSSLTKQSTSPDRGYPVLAGANTEANAHASSSSSMCCCCVDSIDIENMRVATPDEVRDFGAEGATGHCFDVRISVSPRNSPGGRCTMNWMEHGIAKPASGSWIPSDAAFPYKEMIDKWADMKKDQDMFAPFESAFSTSPCPKTSVTVTDCPAVGLSRKRIEGKWVGARFERWLYIVVIARSGCPECPPRIAWFKQYIKVTGFASYEDYSEVTVELPMRAQGGENYLPPDLPDPNAIGEMIGKYAR